MEFKGQAASPGIGIGGFIVIEDLPKQDYSKITIGKDQIGAEQARLDQAIENASAQIAAIRQKALDKGETSKIEVMDAHAMIILDPVFKETILQKMKNLICAEGAVQMATEEMALTFEALDDAYFRERAQDVRDIGSRFQRNLLGIEAFSVKEDAPPFILIGSDITPSLFASLPTEKVLGIVADIGGKTSHTAILAGNAGIPGVLGCTGISQAAKNLSPTAIVAVDGDNGKVILDIQDQELAALKAEKDRREKIKLELLPLASLPTITKDGTAIDLFANITGEDGVALASKVGAEGIGLYRTEFLYMDRPDLPSEEEQYKVYSEVLKGMKGKPVIFRTMDIGGDKEVESLKLEAELNPFLGYRAIRICLDQENLFLTQLRALLRASAHGPVSIMFPMIQSLEEFRLAKTVLEKAKTQLKAEQVPFTPLIPTGIMIEIPSVAVIADILIEEADFFSIGTNDLTQYSLAVDRMNQKIGHLYNHFHPGVLRLISNSIHAANQAGGNKFCGMCGEMAGDPLATILLAGLGLHEFSVSPAKLLLIRKILSSVDLHFAREIALKAMTLKTAKEVETFLKESIPESLKIYLT